MKNSRPLWRLIINDTGRGAWNMALDEAILESVANYQQSPTLRLYSWNPFCLSLGYAQPISDINVKLLEKKGWDLVRRTTGGRAILHAEELTYSVAAPQDDPRVRGSVLVSYRKISKALLYALELVGVKAESKLNRTKPIPAQTSPVCFEVPSNYEITYHGKKVIGSAQARRLNSILQHGAIPLSGDITRIIELINPKQNSNNESDAKYLESRACTLESITQKQISWQDMTNAMIRAFHEKLMVDFSPSQVSSEEKKRALELIKLKFANPEWTNRV